MKIAFCLHGLVGSQVVKYGSVHKGENIDTKISYKYYKKNILDLYKGKIIYNYYDMLKPDGYFIVDDISWIPYLKNSWRDNFNLETENRKTFELLIDIFLTNQDNIQLDFSFTASGLAQIKKITDKSLNKKKHINSRIYSIRHFLKNIKRAIFNR